MALDTGSSAEKREAQLQALSHFRATEFVPRRGLSGPHMQTLAGQLLRRRIHLPGSEKRLFRVEDGVEVLCHCHWLNSSRSGTTVLMVHGLEGSSESQYLIGSADKALAAGMNVVRMNVRSCGGTEHLAPTLYHSGLCSDIGAVAKALMNDQDARRIVLLGFSMGGNMVLKLAGEWGSKVPGGLCAVAAVCPALDLGASADALHLPGNRIYERYFVWNLKRRLKHKARLFPDRFDVHRLQGVHTLRQFDDAITAHYFGFANAADYYQRAAASGLLDRIAVPTLVLHSADDPFIKILPESRTKLLDNPHVRYIETKHGGHCGFIAAPDGYDGRWAERTAVDFFQQVCGS
jgi:predicted alpha/beta-fold hydrolase